MYKFKFNIVKEDIDTHVKNSLSEEEREMLKNVKFVPFNVHCTDDMDIEVIAVGVLEPETESNEDSTEGNENSNENQG